MFYKHHKYAYEQCKKIVNATEYRWTKIAAYCNLHTKLLSQNKPISKLYTHTDAQQI